MHRANLRLARELSRRSTDPVRQVGALLTTDAGNPIAVGWNSFPAALRQCSELWADPVEKARRVVHAEERVLRGFSGGVLYLWPVPPCSRCCRLIIDHGVKEVVVLAAIPAGWEHHLPDWEVSYDLLWEAGVILTRVRDDLDELRPEEVAPACGTCLACVAKRLRQEQAALTAAFRSE